MELRGALFLWVPLNITFDEVEEADEPGADDRWLQRRYSVREELDSCLRILARQQRARVSGLSPK